MNIRLAGKVRLLSGLGVDADGLNRWVAGSALGHPLSVAQWARLGVIGECEGVDADALEAAIDGYLLLRGELAKEVGLDE